MRKLSLMLLAVTMLGCAQGRVDLLDNQGNVVGYCSADFNFHWYGAQESVNYILYLCAREHIERGYTISDESILDNDYTLPTPPDKKNWNKKLAKETFVNGLISEEKLGYILAAVEYTYWIENQKAEKALADGEITRTEYEQRVAKAKAEFEGGQALRDLQ